MAVFFREGEIKKRPGVYQRHSNTDVKVTATSAHDGFCAIPVQAAWGPLGVVVKNTNIGDPEKTYGKGTYGAGYTVPAAVAMFEGGASTVYTYRMGTGGAQGTLSLADGMTVTAKYAGTMPVAIAIQAKLGDPTKKQLLVYADGVLVETFDFTADATNEGQNLIKKAAESKYVTITAETAPAAVTPVAAAEGTLAGGENPTVTNEDYSKAFSALEPYYYNTIALDVDDDENMTLSLLLQAYLKNAYQLGKLGIAVVGEKTSVEFDTRCAHGAAFNDGKCVYLGNGYVDANGNNIEGVLAICYTAGLIASTPANKGITHTIIPGATDLIESLTYAQYEQGIDNGVLLLSRSADGEIWYDSAITTLVDPEAEDLDEGWMKIRRVKTRLEMIDRIDRVLAPKVGRITCDTDGVADIIQSAERVLADMVNERKLAANPTFIEDPANPHKGDSAWFIIQADDYDSLEKIYLHYLFRYASTNA